MTSRDKRLSGLATYAIAILVGLGAGLIVLALAARYSDDRATAALRLVQKHDRDDAAKDRARFSYAINYSACNAHRYIDGQISASQELLETYQHATNDTALDKQAKRRNQDRIDATVKSIAAARFFRSLYTTVPSNFDCTTLPHKPPK